MIPWRCVLSTLFLAVLLNSPARADLIISQYYEGSSNDRWLEITNVGPSSVDLSAGFYSVSLFVDAQRESWKSNGSPTATTSLSGNLGSGESIVLRNTNAANPAYAQAGSIVATAIDFNGDDSVVLWSGTSMTSSFLTSFVVDSFGVTSNNYGNLSYVRNVDILTGTTSDFDSNDWSLFSNAAVGNASPSSSERLGNHVFTVPEPSAAMLLLFSTSCVLLRRRSHA